MTQISLSAVIRNAAFMHALNDEQSNLRKEEYYVNNERNGCHVCVKQSNAKCHVSGNVVKSGKLKQGSS